MGAKDSSVFAKVLWTAWSTPPPQKISPRRITLPKLAAVHRRFEGEQRGILGAFLGPRPIRVGMVDLLQTFPSSIQVMRDNYIYAFLAMFVHICCCAFIPVGDIHQSCYQLRCTVTPLLSPSGE